LFNHFQSAEQFLWPVDGDDEGAGAVEKRLKLPMDLARNVQQSWESTAEDTLRGRMSFPRCLGHASRKMEHAIFR